MFFQYKNVNLKNLYNFQHKINFFLHFLFPLEMETNTSNSESQKPPNVSFDTFDSDESVIFIKETFNVKYNGPLPKPSTSKASVQMKKIDITEPPPPSSKYQHIYMCIIYNFTKIHCKCPSF